MGWLAVEGKGLRSKLQGSGVARCRLRLLCHESGRLFGAQSEAAAQPFPFQRRCFGGNIALESRPANPTNCYSADLAGTLVFAIEGPMADLDLTGLMVLAFATALERWTSLRVPRRLQLGCVTGGSW